MSLFSKWTQADVDRHNSKATGSVPAPVPATQSSAPSRKLESDIQEEIEAWLKTQVHRAWWDRKRMDVATTSRKGVPDFVGVFASIAFGIEVKRPGEKPTTEQLGELAWMRKAGARTAVVFSRDEAVQFFTSLHNLA